MRTIGFVGTAKNTGKTTTALHMLELANAAGLRTALTSIGYDGESIDHVTGLLKPRYYVRHGIIIATASNCLELGSAKCSDIRPTGLRTILGDIVIASVSEPGTVVLAGPNRKSDLYKLLDQLASLDLDLALVDGALNRLAAMHVVDGMVLSTGAAFDEQIDSIASHAAAIESLFHYPLFANSDFIKGDTVTLISEGTASIPLEFGSILDESSLQSLLEQMNSFGIRTVWIPGVFSPSFFETMIESPAGILCDKEFVFASPINLLAAGCPDIWKRCFVKLIDQGGHIFYKDPLALHFITVNPFYPKYQQKNSCYTAAYVDKDLLLSTVGASIKNTLVIDILQPPHPDLLSKCKLDSIS
jgi:molybdopterin-guanine dinucleotide biosynthesis protein